MNFDDLKKNDAVYQHCRKLFGGETPAETYRKLLEFHAQQLGYYGEEGQSHAFAVGRLAALLHSDPSQLGAVAVMLGADAYAANLRQTRSFMSRDTFRELTEGITTPLVAEVCRKSTATINKYRSGALPIPAEVAGRIRTLAHMLAFMVQPPD